ncbi:type II toxin-antitoxin system antitoxin MazE9 [Nocardioides lentus]|uniref:Type II toxin-antitoxin system antitoxin MazE9 n=1 Tax=Nocardioides lentus TaxID=338077 RepID=A0ABP5B340_9ACTN
MKLSVSLTDADVAALDAYVEQEGLPSRSAAVQQAVRRLPHPGLTESYAEAWEEWERSTEAEAWSAVDGDGVPDAPR